MKELIHMSKLLLIALVAALLIKTVFISVIITGESMYPTLKDGQKMVGNALVYNFSKPESGDIIIFKPNLRFDVTYVKRIIAVPGDFIEIRDNEVYLNDEILYEDYILEPMKYSEDLARYQLLPGEYFVMGDNRNNSTDSRWFGHIRIEQIIGRLKSS